MLVMGRALMAQPRLLLLDEPSLGLAPLLVKEIFEIIKPEAPHFGYCIEIPIKTHQAGLKIGEIPSFERKRIGGEAKVNILSVGSKTLWTFLNQKLK